MPTWDDAAQWYLGRIRDSRAGFNELATETALSLLGEVREQVVVDVGCGEGHVARRLARAGARVIGVEPTRDLLAAARAAEEGEPRGVSYRWGTAEALPELEDGSVDAVCAVLVLHHVADLAGALGEVRRVLRVAGTLVVVLPHPWTDHPGASWTDPGDVDAGQQRVIGDYAGEGFWSSGAGGDVTSVTSVKDIGWYHRTVATWFTSIAVAGFTLTEVREPFVTPSAGCGPRAGSPPEGSGPSAGLPRFLAFRATRDDSGR